MRGGDPVGAGLWRSSGHRRRRRFWRLRLRLLVRHIAHVHIKVLIALHAIRHHNLQLVSGGCRDEERAARAESGRASDRERVGLGSVECLDGNGWRATAHCGDGVAARRSLIRGLRLGAVRRRRPLPKDPVSLPGNALDTRDISRRTSSSSETSAMSTSNSSSLSTPSGTTISSSSPVGVVTNSVRPAAKPGGHVTVSRCG